MPLSEESREFERLTNGTAFIVNVHLLAVSNLPVKRAIDGLVIHIQ